MSLTSQKLQVQFPQIYQQLFSTSECVTSGHFSFNRFPGAIGDSDAVIKIKQKLPLRCYVGISKSTGGLFIDRFNYYKTTEQQFVSVSYDTVDETIEKSLSLCVDRFKKYFNIAPYAKLNLISELERGLGCALSGTFFITICLGLGVTYGLIKHDCLGDTNNATIQKLLSIAYDMEGIAKYGTYTPAPLSTLLSSNQPVFYCHNEKSPLCYHYGDILSLYPQNSLYDELGIQSFLLVSGKATKTKFVQTSRLYDKTKLDRSKNTFLQAFGGHLSDYYDVENYYETMVDAGFVLGTELLHCMKNVYENGQFGSAGQELIEQINEIGHYARVVEGQDPFFELLDTKLGNIELEQNVSFGLMPMYTSKGGGTYLITTLHPNADKIIDRLIEVIHEQYPSAYILYDSSQSATPKSGVECLQFIHSDVFSEHVEQTDLSYKDNHGNSQLGTMDELMERFGANAIIVDTIYNKIYCKGVKLTSKEINSQITTTEIFSKIINSNDHRVRNDELAPSSITKQQNQMLGKIILPLRKLTKEQFGEVIPLECHGNLREFDVQLKKTSITIGIISKTW